MHFCVGVGNLVQSVEIDKGIHLFCDECLNLKVSTSVSKRKNVADVGNAPYFDFES